MIRPLVKELLHSAVRAAYAGHGQPKRPGTEPPDLPPIVLGTGHFYRLYKRWSFPREAQATALLDAAFEAGCNAFDTARVYGNGLSDQVLGKWLRSRRVRDQVVLIAKGGHPDAEWKSRLGPEALTEDLDRTLSSVAVDYVDHYLLHRDDPAIAVGPIMETLHTFVQAGKVTAIGASNWSHKRIEEANAYAAERGLTPFATSSPQFSLAEAVAPPWPGCVSITGAGGAEARTWYETTQMPVLAWSPLAGGYLSQRADADGSPDGTYASEANAKRRDRLHQLATRRGIPAEQIALAYLLRQPMKVIPVAAASTPARFRELLAATGVPLSIEERDWLDLRTDSIGAG